MGRTFARFGLVTLFFLLLSPAALAVSVEQVQAVMPTVDIYLYDEEGALPDCPTEDIQAQLEDRPLSVQGLERSEQGIFYFFMLDVSSSIPADYFASAKQAVLDTYAEMRPQDRLGVITFGNEVRRLLVGGESRQEVVSALEGLTCRDGHTKFYDAMDVLIEAVASVEDMRRVAVVLSDGIDDTDAGMTQAELEGQLQRSGVSVYALAVDSGQEDTIQAFRAFIRLSGGELYPFSPDNATQVLSELLNRIGTVWRLRLTAADNQADGQSHLLSLRLGDNPPITAQVNTQRWTPDHKPPYVTAVIPDDSAAVVLQFSEPMLGLEDSGHFALRNPAGQAVSVTPEVSLTGDAVTLRTEGLTDEAGWLLTLSGLTDASMEENPLEAEVLPLYGRSALSGDGSSAVPQEEAHPAAEGKREGVQALAVLAGVLLAAALGVWLLLRTRRTAAEKACQKKEEPKVSSAGNKQAVRFLFQADREKDEK